VHYSTHVNSKTEIVNLLRDLVGAVCQGLHTSCWLSHRNFNSHHSLRTPSVFSTVVGILNKAASSYFDATCQLVENSDWVSHPWLLDFFLP